MLNEPQKKAVTSDSKYVRVIAGAGSGKTRVLTMRIAYLIEEYGTSAKSILAITFTNKAANEMRERVEKMVSCGGGGIPFISTIHSLCARLLRIEIDVLGYPRNFTICDAEDQKSILKKIYKVMNFSSDEVPYNTCLSKISKFKTHNISPEKAIRHAFESGEREDYICARVYEEYKEYLDQRFLLDFDDLIIKTVYIFDHFPDVLKWWQSAFAYILVDEFQDVDSLQYRLIKHLAGDDNSLFVVGDPDQTIYTWRGAEVDIIINFDKDFPGTETIYMNQNYRSTEPILDSANDVIAHNTNRLKKDLFTSSLSSDKVIYHISWTREAEARWLVKEVNKLHLSGKAYSDMAVLYRANFLSRAFEKELIRARIPYEIHGGLRFFERKEVKDMLSYLHLCVDEDDLAFNRIVNVPRRSVGPSTLSKIELYAAADQSTEYEALKNHLSDIARGKIKKNLEAFINLVEGWKVKLSAPKADYGSILLDMITTSGYEQMLRTAEEDDRRENLRELVYDLDGFQKSHPDGILQDYLQLAALYGDKNDDKKTDHLTLMTVHAAKGLEFDTVFVTDMVETIFPNRNALLDGPEGIEEERRLAYVAYTRAKKHLYLISYERGSKPWIHEKRSRFISEIKPKRLSVDRSLDEEY